MREQLVALYELQSLDVEISKAKQGLAALDGAKAMQKQLKAAKQAMETAEKSLADAEIELKDSELKLKSIDEKRTATEKRLYGGAVTNPKELSSLEKEIAHLKNQQGQLDERVLELYDSVESLRVKANSVKELTGKYQKRVDDILVKETAERKRLEAELKELESRRDSLEVKVSDKKLLSKYDSLRKRTGSTGIAKVIDGKCGGCHILVTSFTIRKLFEAKEIECCESCGCILMLDIE